MEKCRIQLIFYQPNSRTWVGKIFEGKIIEYIKPKVGSQNKGIGSLIYELQDGWYEVSEPQNSRVDIRSMIEVKAGKIKKIESLFFPSGKVAPVPIWYRAYRQREGE